MAGRLDQQMDFDGGEGWPSVNLEVTGGSRGPSSRVMWSSRALTDKMQVSYPGTCMQGASVLMEGM